MKKVIHLTFLVAVTLILQNCTANDDSFNNIKDVELKCSIDDSILEAYNLDAHVLAVDLMNSDGGFASDQITIPDSYVENILKGLTAIYKVNNETTNNIFSTIKIHTHKKEASLKQALISLPIEMINDWKNSGQTTNNELNAIISEYNLTVINVIGSNSVAVVTSDRFLNIKALCNKISEIDDVIYAEPNGISGDGNDISIAENDASFNIKFQYGFGDCMAGCINKVFWNFEVNSSCQVSEIN